MEAAIGAEGRQAFLAALQFQRLATKGTAQLRGFFLAGRQGQLLQKEGDLGMSGQIQASSPPKELSWAVFYAILKTDPNEGARLCQFSRAIIQLR